MLRVRKVRIFMTEGRIIHAICEDRQMTTIPGRSGYGAARAIEYTMKRGDARVDSQVTKAMARPTTDPTRTSVA